jgi:hypothetical protein
MMKIILMFLKWRKNFLRKKLLRHHLGLIFVLNGYSQKKNCELFNILDIIFNFSDDDLLELI